MSSCVGSIFVGDCAIQKKIRSISREPVQDCPIRAGPIAFLHSICLVSMKKMIKGELGGKMKCII